MFIYLLDQNRKASFLRNFQNRFSSLHFNYALQLRLLNLINNSVAGCVKSFFFLDKNELFHESQCGFREKHSTKHALIDIVNRIQNDLNKEMFSTAVFIVKKRV